MSLFITPVMMSLGGGAGVTVMCTSDLRRVSTFESASLSFFLGVQVWYLKTISLFLLFVLAHAAYTETFLKGVFLDYWTQTIFTGFPQGKSQLTTEQCHSWQASLLLMAGLT